MALETSQFTGFRPEALDFLADLAQNNDRTWFQPRKAEFERLLKEPMEALVAALAERFEARGLPLRADPRRSIFRSRMRTEAGDSGMVIRREMLREPAGSPVAR